MTSYSITGEISAAEREQLILEHLPQVRLIGRRIHDRVPDNVTLDDLISAGVVGLISAIDHFDPKHNVKLKTYAEYKIRGAILDSLRGLDWAPRQKRRMARQVETAIQTASKRLHRDPTEEDIASELKLDLKEYHRWLLDLQGLAMATLECADEDGRDLLAYAADDEEKQPLRLLERSELEKLLAQAIEQMPSMDRTVISQYYLEELTLREIAEVVHLHQSRISQIKSQAILRLRAYLAKRWPMERGI
ncbi:MAG TPA: FliA/WhiG family RNA polymerase sigma factor [Bryobacteraceae bacterium]|nr:FliA/WhiG family RNA polymerase sigma factor [Bryobacteraceae bacterium]